MASDKHLARLKEGAEAWNKWRQTEPLARPDLSGVSLTLAQKQWGETNGGPINLADAMLGGANLRHATLIGGNLSGAILSGANLTGARLRQADLRNANLSNVRFDDADLADAIFDGANLTGADLRGARNLSARQIETTRGDAKTQLPQNFVPPKTWRNGSLSEQPSAAEVLTSGFKSRWHATLSRPAANPASNSASNSESKPATKPATKSATKPVTNPVTSPARAPAAAPKKPRWQETFERLSVSQPSRSAAAMLKDWWQGILNRAEASVTGLGRSANSLKTWGHAAVDGTVKRSIDQDIASSKSIAARAAALDLKAAVSPAAALLRKRETIAIILGIAGLALLIGLGGLLPLKTPDGTLTLTENAPAAKNSPSSEEAPQWLTVSQPTPVAVHDIRDGNEVAPVAKKEGGGVLQTKEIATGAMQQMQLRDSAAPSLAVQSLSPQGQERPIDESTPALKAEDVRDNPIKLTKAQGSAAQATVRPLPNLPGDIRAVGTPKAPAEPPAEAKEPAAAPQPAAAQAIAQAGAEPVKTPAEAAQPAAAQPQAEPVEKQAEAPQLPNKPVDVPPPVQKRAVSPNPADVAKLTFTRDRQSVLQAARSQSSVVDYLRTPQHSTEWVEIFIERFYLSTAELKEPDIRRIYSDPVDYFGKQHLNLDVVAREKAEYYRDWPKRHYVLVPGSIKVKWKSAKVADVTFLYDFKVSAPNKKAHSGRGRARLTLDLAGKTGRIVREDGEVLAGN